MMTFRDELTKLLNQHGFEGVSNTPDFVMAEFLIAALNVFNVATNSRGCYRKTVSCCVTPTECVQRGIALGRQQAFEEMRRVLNLDRASNDSEP